jgi:4-diphosphocytidyl-2-C-methyl-D-erythritol kinase
MILAEMTPADLRPANAVRTNPPAKVNLTLEVFRRRPDGYHELRSVVVGVGLRDSLRVESSLGADASILCDLEELCNDGNLAVRAAKKLAAHLNRPADVTMRLEKRIPLGGGLGGGSSDAAAALRLCNELWEARLTAAELARLGAELGSDVPLFFHLPSALVTGRGEIVTPVSMHWRGWALLLLPKTQTVTAEVYAAWKPQDHVLSRRRMEDDLRTCSRASELMELLYNELEPAVFRAYPGLRKIHDTLTQELGPVRVSGSGSSMYLLFDDPESAVAAAAKVEANALHVRTVVVEAPVGVDPVVTYNQ